jgi:hypothetical protein
MTQIYANPLKKTSPWPEYPLSRGPHRNRFLEVQAEIRAHMVSDKKTLLVEANVSTKHNLMTHYVIYYRGT